MHHQLNYEDHIIDLAKGLLLHRLDRPGAIINGLEDLHLYLQLEYATLENEQFGCVFIDSSYRVINHEKLFRGTITTCAVYPREIARAALLHDASFAVVVHNHPSLENGISADDIKTTETIETCLAAVDIVLVDHIIVVGGKVHSLRMSGTWAKNKLADAAQ